MATATKWFECAYHLAMLIAVRAHGFDEGDPTPRMVGTDTQFFPTKLSSPVTPQQLARWITELGKRFTLDEPDDNPSTANFGGHSCRRAGAQHWSRRRMARHVLRALGRWRSRSIEDYIGTALTDDIGVEDLNVGMRQGATAPQSMCSDVSLRDDIFEIKRMLSRCLLGQARKLPRQKLVHKAPKKELTIMRLIVYTGSTAARRKIHRVQQLHGPSDQWHTHCGWKFGRGSRCELFLEMAWKQINKSITATWCTSGCFTHMELAEVQQVGLICHESTLDPAVTPPS